jgi:hypothetical protein
LGASLILAQHNDVIGALGEYCGMEAAEQAEQLLEGTVPDSWDTSASLLKTGPRKLRSAVRQKGHGISRFFTDRLYASLLLIVGPGVAGAVIGVGSLQGWWVRLLCALGDGAAIIWTIFLLWNSYSERHRRWQKLLAWKAARSPYRGSPIPVTGTDGAPAGHWAARPGTVARKHELCNSRTAGGHVPKASRGSGGRAARTRCAANAPLWSGPMLPGTPACCWRATRTAWCQVGADHSMASCGVTTPASIR